MARWIDGREIHVISLELLWCSSIACSVPSFQFLAWYILRRRVLIAQRGVLRGTLCVPWLGLGRLIFGFLYCQ